MTGQDMKQDSLSQQSRRTSGIDPQKSEDALALMDVQLPTPASMLQTAIQQGMKVEELRVLADLYKEMEDRQAAKEFTAAVVAFHNACPPIPHDAELPHLTREGGKKKATYATLPQVCRTVNPILHPLELAYSWDSAVSADDKVKVTCTLRHVAGHSQTASFEGPVDRRNSALSASQQNAVVLGFGERKSLIQVLGIFTADEDMDGAVPVGRIVEAQEATIEQRMAETHTDRQKFLEHFKIERVGDLPVDRYKDAMGIFDAKAKLRP